MSTSDDTGLLRPDLSEADWIGVGYDDDGDDDGIHDGDYIMVSKRRKDPEGKPHWCSVVAVS